MSSRTSLWEFTHAARSAELESAYREHFLENDLRQLKISVYVISILLIALNVLDLTRLANEPEFLLGIVVKTFFLFLGIAIVILNQKLRKPVVLDLCVLSYTVAYVLAILIAHMMNDYSATRITAIVLIFIYTAHMALPVYSSYLFPAIAILITGESYILFATSFDDLGLDKPAILVVYLFAFFMSVLISAAHQRARFQIFKTLDEVNTLSGLLPICANCKSIRNDDGYYQEIEQYIAANSDAEFSHGICPVCAEKLYGDIRKKHSSKDSGVAE